jgi:rSAM/selenodomain-associated transferase 2
MHAPAPISVVIPTLNAERALPATLASLVPAAVEGLVREVIVSDGGSADATRDIVREAGARLVEGERGRGGQLARGADAARGAWLLFLHADTAIEASWSKEALALIESGEERAGVFTLRFAAGGLAPALVAAGAMIRTRVLLSPYGDQGLLISRRLYDAVGGYRPLPLFEDVDFVERLVRARGRRALKVLKSEATTSPDRYLHDGYARRVLKNALCLAMYKAGVAPGKIASLYQ